MNGQEAAYAALVKDRDAWARRALNAEDELAKLRAAAAPKAHAGMPDWYVPGCPGIPGCVCG